MSWRTRNRNQLQIEARFIQMATATVAASRSTELYISRATIQLRRPLAEAPPRIYEWRTQVNSFAAQPEPKREREQQEELIVSSKQNGSTTAAVAAVAAATPTYTPPRIQGNEAKRKNLPQTLGNFFEAERYDSAWNRVTKWDENEKRNLYILYTDP